MILDRHPMLVYYPEYETHPQWGHRYRVPGHKYIGFWRSRKEPIYPEFADPAAFIDTGWDLSERALVARYLRDAPFVEDYRGSSTCRLCGKHSLGHREQSDGLFTWPEGFPHYIEEHAVKPPEDFLERVRAPFRAVHFVGYALESALQFCCDGTWSIPASSELSKDRKTLDAQQGVYLSEGGRFYTFEETKVTCPECVDKIFLRRKPPGDR